MHQANRWSDPLITQRSQPTGTYEVGSGQVSAKYLYEQQMRQLGGRKFGAWKLAIPLVYESIEQPPEIRCLR